MLRALALAALLLFVLLSTLGIASMPGDAVASAAAADAATTSSALITVTTTIDEVGNDGDCSLREAIQAAYQDSTEDACLGGNGDDTIFIPAGHYNLTLGQLYITGTVTLQGSVTATTILDGNEQSRVLYIQPNGFARLFHLEIRNGYIPICASCASDNGAGGGIANYGTTYIANVTIRNSRSGFQSPIEGETPQVGNGGGIFNAATLTITNSTISNNTAMGGGCGESHGGTLRCSQGASGGGIYNGGTLNIQNSTLNGNHGGSGGCPAEYLGYLYCGSGGDGGGIYNSGTLTISNSTFSNNRAGNGGCGRELETQIMRCSPGGEGGAMYNALTLTLSYATITQNKPGTSSNPQDPTNTILRRGLVGGIYNESQAIVASNNILAHNDGSDCGGFFPSSGNNLIEAITYCLIRGGFIHAAAQLGPLQANGGDTYTHALRQNSPAIDAGSCTDGNKTLIASDQRGIARPRGEGCDLGAYESPFTATVPVSLTTLYLVHLPQVNQ